MLQEKFTTPAYQDPEPAPLTDGADLAFQLASAHVTSAKEGHMTAEAAAKLEEHGKKTQDMLVSAEKEIRQLALLTLRNRRQKASDAQPQLGFETKYQITD